jgi:hypothetical protein
MINRIEAYEILSYLIPDATKRESESMVKKATEKVKTGNVVNEMKLWDLILKNENCKRLLDKRGICSIEQLMLAQFEWKMKYQWTVYKHVRSSYDYNLDDADTLDFLD